MLFRQVYEKWCNALTQHDGIGHVFNRDRRGNHKQLNPSEVNSHLSNTA